jgi:hypothetical protein
MSSTFTALHATARQSPNSLILLECGTLAVPRGSTPDPWRTDLGTTRGPAPSRIEGRNDSDRRRLDQLHGSRYVGYRRLARRNQLGWNPRLLHPDPVAERMPQVLPRHVAATITDGRHVRVTPRIEGSCSNLKSGAVLIR